MVRWKRFTLAFASVILFLPSVQALPIDGEVAWASHAEIRGSLSPATLDAGYLTFALPPGAATAPTWTFSAAALRILTSTREEREPTAAGVLRDDEVRWENETRVYRSIIARVEADPAPDLGSTGWLWAESDHAFFHLAEGPFQVRSTGPASTWLTVPGSHDPSRAQSDSPHGFALPGRLLEVTGRVAATAQGNLEAALFGWRVTLWLPDGSTETLRTGVERAYDAQTGLPRGYRVSYALLALDEAHVEVAPRAEARFYAPLLHYDGAGAFPMGQYEGPRSELAASYRSASTLDLPGQLWLGVPPTEGRTNVARVWGEAAWTESAVDDGPVAPGALPWAAVAAAAGLAATLAFLARWLGVAPLLSRLRDRLQDNPTRRRIEELIRAEPGLTLSDTVARLGIGWGTAAYHTQILLRQGRVRDLRFLNRVCFFPSTYPGLAEQLQTVLLRQPNYESIMRILGEMPGASQRDIAARSGHARQYISRLVNKLERAGLVRAEPSPAGRRYFAAPNVPVVRREAPELPPEPPREDEVGLAPPSLAP